MMQPVMQFKSHIDGKNADVTIWSDRIEWSRKGALRGGMWGMGMLGRKGGDSNMIPIRAIQGVTTHKGGVGYTTVEVVTGGDRIGFRVTKDQAEQVRSAIVRLMV